MLSARRTPDPLADDPLPEAEGTPSRGPANAATVVVGLQALGVLAVAVAGALSRQHHPSWGEEAFWAGVLLIVAPTAMRLVSASPTRTERVVLVTGLGLAAYLSKVVLWPVEFTFHDELVHWRTTGDIIATHHLFASNPITPVSSLYPGTEIVTSALSELSGLPVFASGLIVVGAARLLLMLAMYLIFERVSGSPRAAGLSTLLYAGNPNFMFFDAQFAYESLALPLAVFLLYLALRSSRSIVATAALALPAAGLVITHHLTSWLFAAGFVGALAVRWIMRREAGVAPSRLGTASAAAVTLIALWVGYVGTRAITYVGPSLGGGGTELLGLLQGKSPPRKLFAAAAQVSPIWEQLLAAAAAALTVLALPFGLMLIWRRYRHNPNLIFFGLVAALYPASLVLRLSGRSVETSTRLSEFLFLGVAAVLGLLGARVLGNSPRVRGAGARQLACALVISLILGGGIIIGWGRWSRLPGPYLVSADARSVEPQGTTAATWMRTHLGPGNRLATDRVNGVLMASPLGEQHPVNGSADNVSVTDLLLAPRLTTSNRSKLAQGRVRYVVTDRRLSTGLPLAQVYVDAPEPAYTRPLSRQAAEKFDHARGISRVFDGGVIQINAVSPDLLR